MRDAQWEQGEKVRGLLRDRGIRSVAADGFAAPAVVVAYTDRDDVKSGKAFAEHGMQIAAGVPLMVGEGDDYKSFRLGLFGLDKLKDVDASVARRGQRLPRHRGVSGKPGIGLYYRRRNSGRWRIFGSAFLACRRRAAPVVRNRRGRPACLLSRVRDACARPRLIIART